MQKIFDILKNISLFSDISDGDLSSVLSYLDAKIVEYKKDGIIFMEGDAADMIGVLLFGKVHIVKEDYYGNRNIVSEIRQGELFAEVFACAESILMPVSVLAVEDSRVLLLNFKKILSEREFPLRNVLLSNMLKTISIKTLLLNRKIDILSKRSTREKLIAYLSAQTKAAGSPEFTIPFNRQELADFLCVDRSAMSAELSRMRREGIIDFSKNKFRML